MATANGTQSKHSEASSDGHVIQKSLPRRRRPLLAGILLTAVVVLGLALGLGLGLGLKRRKHGQPSTTTTNSNSVPVVPRSQLVDPSQFVLSPSFDVNATAQSREYNWTISEINSDPTGTSKNMIVANGISPGPTVEANIGDRYKILT
jgi:iron transport multicopper oxidase